MISECQIFAGINLLEMNKKLQTKAVEEVLSEIRGTDIKIDNDGSIVEVDNCEEEAK